MSFRVDISVEPVFCEGVSLGVWEKAQCPNFRRLSNRSSLIEAKMQRKIMKKKQDMMNRGPSRTLFGFMVVVIKMSFEGDESIC